MSTLPRGAASRSRQHRQEEEYMEGVSRGVLGGVYMEEPLGSRGDIGEDMDVVAVGTRGGRRWDPPSSSRPAFTVLKAAHAAVWEDLKDIRPPLYNAKIPYLDHFLEKVDDGGMTFTEDMDPAAAEKYVFKGFGWHLPEVLQELHFVAATEGKIRTLKRPRSGPTTLRPVPPERGGLERG